jgi:hypothetical protein
MSEGTRTADDQPAGSASGGIDSATPTARQASSMALLGVVVVLVLIAIAGVWWYVTSAGAAAEAEAIARMEELGAYARTGQDNLTVNLSLPAAHDNIDAIVKEMSELSSLKSLNARDAPLTDEHLATIGQLDSLLALDLTDTVGNSKITDAGIEHLTGLDNLANLEFFGTSITAEGLTAVGQIQSLKVLNISSTQVEGDLSELLPLSELQRLMADDLKLSDGVATTLAQLPNLAHLSVKNSGVSEEALGLLRKNKPGMEVVR